MKRIKLIPQLSLFHNLDACFLAPNTPFWNLTSPALFLCSVGSSQKLYIKQMVIMSKPWYFGVLIALWGWHKFISVNQSIDWWHPWQKIKGSSINRLTTPQSNLQRIAFPTFFNVRPLSMMFCRNKISTPIWTSIKSIILSKTAKGWIQWCFAIQCLQPQTSIYPTGAPCLCGLWDGVMKRGRPLSGWKQYN